MTEKQTVECPVHGTDMAVSSCLSRQEICHEKPIEGVKLQAYRIYRDSCGKCDLGKKLYRESKGETMPALKTCVKCKRELPADTGHFDVANRAVDNLTRACKDCRGKDDSKGKGRVVKPSVEQRKCKGPCGRTLALTAEHFHRATREPGGFRSVCKTCRNTAERLRVSSLPKPSHLVQVDLRLLPESSRKALEAESRENFRTPAGHIAFLLCDRFSGQQEQTEG